MNRREISARRLHNQGVSAPRKSAEDVVSSLGAVQAQDHPAATWAIALRTAKGTDDEVTRAVRERRIVRSWPLRVTLHYVPAADLRWMLDLTRPRTTPTMQRRAAQLGLDEASIRRAEKALLAAMRGEKPIRRDQALTIVGSVGVEETNRRAYVLCRLATDGMICFGPHEGKEPTFVLVDEWVPGARALHREEALATLARRYFGSHGPATLLDFVWWTGLTRGEARRAIASIAEELVEMTVGDTTYFLPRDRSVPVRPGAYLLPGFDEYLLGYADRSAALDPEHASKIVPGGNGIFLRTLVVEGRVMGTWRPSKGSGAETLTVEPFVALSARTRAAAARAARAWSSFVGAKTTVTFA